MTMRVSTMIFEAVHLGLDPSSRDPPRACCVLRDQIFTKTLRECETLSLAVLDHLFSTSSTFLDLLSTARFMIPQQCDQCQKRSRYPCNITRLVNREVYGRCADCQQL